MEIKNTEVILNTDFKLFKKEKLVFGTEPEDVNGDTLYLDKSVTVLFGKNGTGKSTLSKKIKETFGDECHLFNGFEGIVGEKKELNAVVLGSKNNEIEEQIKQKNSEIEKIEEEIKNIRREIEEFDENGNKYEDNLFTKRQRAIEAYKKQSGKLDNFYVVSAKTIKEGLKIPNYNKNNFSEDLESRKRLNDEERKNNEELLKNSTSRKASLLKETDFTPETLSDAVNGILQKSVKETIDIERLKNSPKKQAFAKEGLDLHKPGDKCAFCGHEIEGSVLEELHTYFSADEVEKFEDEIEGKLKEIETLKKTINDMTIVVDNFYPHLKAKAEDL